MALRKLVDKLTKPVEEQDRETLVQWCDERQGAALDDLVLRRPVRIAGEVRSVRIVPRAGADALEATVTDGRQFVTAVFLGRRKVIGVSPGRRLILDGVVTEDVGEKFIYNPIYTLQ